MLVEQRCTHLIAEWFADCVFDRPFRFGRTGWWEIGVMNVDGSQQPPLLPAGMMHGLEIQYNSMDERIVSWQ